MHHIKDYNDYIVRETLNIRKSINRPRSLGGILTKKQQLKEAITAIKDILQKNQNRISLRDWLKEIENYEALKVRVKLAIGILDNTEILPIVPVINNNMASVLEIIKTASALIPNYDGSSDKLDATISAIRALEPIINDENRAAAINVILSKFSGKARSAIGGNPATLNDIIQNLSDKCKSQEQPEVIQAKLNALRQTSELNKFTKQVEKLTRDLEKCYIAENVPVDTASKLATKAGVKALANGIRSQETKLLLKAGQYDNYLHDVKYTGKY